MSDGLERWDASAPRVTALIDTYNYGRFIEEAIESVLAQDFSREQLEVMVVDDGSTDDTAERVKKYAGRVQYVYKRNGGQASAFNFGINKARGEIIALLDADDYWLPGKLRRVVDEFDKHPGIGLVYHALRQFRMKSGEWSEGAFSAVSGEVPKSRKKILEYTAAQTSGLAFRKQFLQRLLPLNEAMTIQPDGLLAALIIFLGPVKAIEEPLSVYRIHDANLFFETGREADKTRQSRRIRTLSVLLKEMDVWLTTHGYNLRQREILAFRRRWRLLYETEEFRFKAPGRVRFCMHLMRAMHCMNPCLSTKIQIVNALNLLGTLLFGYESYTRLDEWRIALKRAVFGSDALQRT